MLEAYTDVAVFMIVGVLFVAINLLLGRLLRPHRPYAEKLLPYECGETPVGEGQIKFHIRYYLFALVFVVFEVETVFLYPWSVVLSQIGLFAFVEMILFIAMLLLGLVYAWRKGALRWV